MLKCLPFLMHISSRFSVNIELCRHFTGTAFLFGAGCDSHLSFLISDSAACVRCFCSHCPFLFSLPLIQPASQGPSNPNSVRDPVPPARPTVAPVHEDPIFVPARMLSIALTATPLSPAAPVSHPPLHRVQKNPNIW